MKKSLAKIFLIFTAILAMAIPVGAKAATSAELCNQLFVGDDTNIFKEVLCSLTRVTSRTVADLATNTTCTIQSVGNASNYDQSILFAPISSVNNSSNISANTCAVTSLLDPSTTPAILPVGDVLSRPPFGTKPSTVSGAATIATGLYTSSRSSQLSKNLTTSTTGETRGNNIAAAFGISRSIMAVLAFVALLIFAFANILHIDINTYAVKKALPSILIALIGGVLSLSIVFIFSRGVDQLYRINIFDPAHTINQMGSMFPSSFNNNFLTTTNTPAETVDNSVQLIFNVGGSLLGTPSASGIAPNATFVSGIFGSILLTIPAVLIIVFQYVLALRPFAVGLLTIIAPFAFACLVLPQTQVIFRKWWTYLLIALLYAPVVNFTFYITNLITAGVGAGTPANQIAFVAAWVFRVAVFVYLIRLPFTIESDAKKITARLAKTSFGEALGLGRFAGALTSGQVKEIQTTAGNVNISASKTLSSEQTKNLIASTAPAKRIFSRQIGGSQELDKMRNRPFVSSATIPNLRTIIREANDTNMNRAPSLIARSIADIKPDVFKAVVDQSDLKLWHDTRLIDQLKNQNGQTLNNEGVALRADSIRKIVRLAQVTQNGAFSNPDALKMMAQKGALSSLPTAALKEAVKQGVLTKEDFRSTYKNDTEKTFQRMQSIEKPFRLDPQSARELMQSDHQDYQSGYKDMATLFGNISRDQRLTPPPPQEVIKNIISQMKTTDGNTFERNGSYFLNRLQNQLKSSQGQIATSLAKAGTPNQAAAAIAVNPRLDFAEAKNYYAKDKMTGPNLQQLKEGFMERDLSSGLIKEVSDIVTQEKSMIGKGVTQKIANGLKNDETIELSDIRDSMKTLVGKMVKPMSPQEVQSAAREINKFHPAAILVTSASIGATDLDKLKSNAQNVVETTEQLIAAGIQKEALLENPAGAQNIVDQKVREKVRQDATGQQGAVSQATPSSMTTKIPNVEISGSTDKTAKEISTINQTKQNNTVKAQKDTVIGNKIDLHDQKDDEMNKNIVDMAINDIGGKKAPAATPDPLSENKKGQVVESEIDKIRQKDDTKGDPQKPKLPQNSPGLTQKTSP